MTGLPASLDDSPQLLDAAAVRRAIVRLSHEIAERHAEGDVVLAGVVTRGVPLAARIASTLAELGQPGATVAVLDARNHRDDRPRDLNGEPALTGLGDADAPSIDGCNVIVVDDVLFTGRTVRAALDALMEHGRPKTVDVLTLIDRGHREIPIRATYVGKNVPTAPQDRVHVRLREVDGRDGAWLVRGHGA